MDIKNDYKMTDLGEIPSEWEIYPLKEITSQIGDGNYSSKYPKSADFIESGIPFLRANNLKNGKLSMKDMKYISLEQHESLKKGHIKVGDIIITVRGQIGNVAITTKEFDDVNINAQLAFLRFNDQISSKFILYFLQSTLIQNLLFSITTGTALQQLPINRLNTLRIIVPPLKEQQKIAEILSTVDEQIEQTDQLIEKTKELKKGLMQQLLTKGIGHTEFKQTELGEIPGEWEVTSLKNLGSFFKGKGIAKKDMSTNGNKCILYGQLYTTYKEIINEVDTYTDINIKNPVIGEKNDLLIPSSGETPFDIATASSLQVNEVYIGGDINVFRPANQMNSDFLSYQINSVRKFELSKLAQGSSIYHLYKDNLEKFDVLVPPLKEQKQIVEILSAVDEEIEGYEEEKVKYEELKKGLMQQLLTGKKRVKVD